MRYLIISLMLVACTSKPKYTVEVYKSNDPRLTEMLKGATPVTDEAKIKEIKDAIKEVR